MARLSVPPPRPLYWRLQLLGWGLYGAFGMALFAAFAKDFGPYLVWIQVTIVLTLFGLSHGLRYLIKRFGWEQLPLLALLGRLLVANALLALVSQVIIWLVILLVIVPTVGRTGPPQGWREFTGYALNVNFVFWLWVAAYFSLHYLRSYRQAEIDKWKLEAAVREAEMQTLKAQINPHFLFNGLNNIRALILEDPERARHMLSHLSELLRYSIQLNRTEQVPLRRELAVVRDYLQLESLQLEERLRYCLDVPDDCLNVAVPPMLVQALVENAIKHGLACRPGGGELWVQARRTAHELHLTVENTGQLQAAGPRPDGTGTGLRNARERLRLLFGARAALLLEQATPATVVARVRLPLGEALIPAPANAPPSLPAAL